MGPYYSLMLADEDRWHLSVTSEDSLSISGPVNCLKIPRRSPFTFSMTGSEWTTRIPPSRSPSCRADSPTWSVRLRAAMCTHPRNRLGRSGPVGSSQHRDMYRLHRPRAIPHPVLSPQSS